LDANGDGIMDVILSATPFAAGPNSIPFNEDVDVIALRAFGKIGLLPGANQPSSLNGDGSNTGNASYDVLNYRLVDTLTWDIPDSGWTVSISGQYQANHLVFEQKNTSQSALIQGLMGELKADPTDASTSYWNPFATQALTCTDRVCSFTGTPDYANTVSVLDAVNIQTHDISDLTYSALEIVATGDLFELTGGAAQVALGAEYRRTDVDVDLNSNYNQCNWHEGGCGFDWEATEEVDSLFFELYLPLTQELEITLSGRHSDYGSDVGDSFDPKVSILYQPTDMISLRANWSTAFIAPTLEDRFEPEDCGLETAPDPLTNDTANSFRVACVSGNPNLEPETADVFNVGAMLSLLDGSLTLGIDYNVYDFEDRIAQTTMNQVLSLDYQAFLAAGFTAGVPADVAAWMADPRSDDNIQRDITGVVTRVTTSKLNAQKMKHVAFDYYASYDLDLIDFGHFNFKLEATQVDEYSYDLGLGLPPGDGVGMQNEDVIEIPPMPEWRMTFTTNWFKDNHSALLRLRYTDEFELDFNSKALQGAQKFFYGSLTMDSILYTDVNYRYTFDSLLGDRQTVLEVGGRNIFDEMPDPIFNLGGIESFVHDIRGRMWYMRVTQDI
ncbi:MAG: TonB-dependent receptor, partial [Gammaproteobacteria bacterium]|nr:TonB-dependent receptor [Gammaproteobacteria bacterium]